MQQHTIDVLKTGLIALQETLKEHEFNKRCFETRLNDARNRLHKTNADIELVRAQIAAIEADIGASK